MADFGIIPELAALPGCCHDWAFFYERDNRTGRDSHVVVHCRGGCKRAVALRFEVSGVGPDGKLAVAVAEAKVVKEGKPSLTAFHKGEWRESKFGNPSYRCWSCGKSLPEPPPQPVYVSGVGLVVLP